MVNNLQRTVTYELATRDESPAALVRKGVRVKQNNIVYGIQMRSQLDQVTGSVQKY